MSAFTALAGQPLTEILSKGPARIIAEANEEARALAIEAGRTPRADMVGTRADHVASLAVRTIVPLLDIAGGAIAAVLGGMQVHRAQQSGDKVDEASGWMLTTGGGLWMAGGVASVCFSALAAPFFVLSGVAALAGLVVGMYKDPGKDFAQRFGEGFGSLDTMGAFRPNWREEVSGWYNAEYFDKTSENSLGLDL